MEAHTSVRPRGVSALFDARARVRFFFPYLNFRLPRSVLTTCRLRRITENCGLVLMRSRIKVRRVCFRFQTRRGDAKGEKGSRRRRAKNGVAEEGQNAQHFRVRQRPRAPEEAKEVIGSVGTDRLRQSKKNTTPPQVNKSLNHC